MEPDLVARAAVTHGILDIMASLNDVGLKVELNPYQLKLATDIAFAAIKSLTENSVKAAELAGKQAGAKITTLDEANAAMQELVSRFGK